MPSRKTLKLILYELLQFAALITPVFVIMERFASLISNLKELNRTTYWLVVAASIAYMTSVTLLVWVPLKYLTLKHPAKYCNEAFQFLFRPVLLHISFCCYCHTVQVQVDNGIRLDHFAELPVSLVLSCLVCVDIIERIRPCRLLGQCKSPVLTRLEQVTTVSGQLHPDEGQNGLTHGQPVASNGSISGRWQNGTDSPRRSPLSARAAGTAYLYSPSSRLQSYSGHLGSLWRRDGRSELFVDSFLFWFDTVELVRVAGSPAVFFSAWVFPVYILAFLSTLRMIITPHSPLLSSAGVALQDFPFFVIRVALIVVFGFITPVLYLLKNVLVCLTFIYFTFMTKLRLFRRETMF
uniref:Transmembrane protein 236 n=1 Tax=Amphiprion percula TaxID=161767 RepID=A0A3P8UB89_AMPPE